MVIGFLNQELGVQSGYGFVHFELSEGGIQSALAAVEEINRVKVINEISFECALTHSLKTHLLSRRSSEGRASTSGTAAGMIPTMPSSSRYDGGSTFQPMNANMGVNPLPRDTNRSPNMNMNSYLANAIPSRNTTTPTHSGIPTGQYIITPPVSSAGLFYQNNHQSSALPQYCTGEMNNQPSIVSYPARHAVYPPQMSGMGNHYSNSNSYSAYSSQMQESSRSVENPSLRRQDNSLPVAQERRSPMPVVPQQEMMFKDDVRDLPGEYRRELSPPPSSLIPPPPTSSFPPNHNHPTY